MPLGAAFITSHDPREVCKCNQDGVIKSKSGSSHGLFPRQTRLVVGVDSNHPRECDCNVIMLVAILDMIKRLKGDHFEAAKGGGEDIRRITEMPEGGGGGASTSIASICHYR